MSTLNEILRANTQNARTVALVGSTSSGFLRNLAEAFPGRIQTTANEMTVRLASLSRPVYGGELVPVVRSADVVFVQYGLLFDSELVASVLDAMLPGSWIVAVGNLPASTAAETVMSVTGTDKTLSPLPWYFYRSRRNGVAVACACKKRQG